MISMLSRVRRSAWTLPLAALAALVVFVINEAAFHRSSDVFATLGERGEARVQLHRLQRGLLDAETGQRGYLLTGRKEYLRPYETALTEVQAAAQWVQRYYGSDPVTAEAGAAVARGTQEKLSELATTLQLYEEGRQDAWRDLLLTDIGREKMERLRVASTALVDLEGARVAADRARLSASLHISRIGVNTMVALSLLAMFVFLRQLATFDAAQLRHAQALGEERDRLEAEVRRRTVELTELARHLQTAREDERNHLARELHDELGALLTAAKLDAARLKRSLGTMAPEVEARLAHLNQTIHQGIELKRRIIEDLHPSSLANLGLKAALEILAREFARRSELQVNCEIEPLRLSDEAEITLYRLVQESLTNVAKYAAARQVKIDVQVRDGRVHVRVTDDGRGFDAARTRGSAHGLVGMRYRVESLGGRLRVTSAPGQGTTLQADWPVDGPVPPVDD